MSNSLVHPTYRHLNRRVRIAGLPLAHWSALALAAGMTWCLAHILPFSATYDLSIALTVCGTPVAIAFAAGVADDRRPLDHLLNVGRWHRHRGIYQAAATRRKPHVK
jgi:hypothetical protein